MGHWEQEVGEAKVRPILECLLSQHLLCIDAFNRLLQPQSLEHEVAPRLQQLPNDPIWLGQIPLQEQDAAAILSTPHRS